jgi:3-phosphoglycerate kinase
MPKLTVRDLDISGKTILMRADFNVPQDEGLNITDDTRITAALPTIRYILDRGAKRIILISHLGRPKGKADAKYSLSPVASRLEGLLNEPVKFLGECVGNSMKQEINASTERIFLLENLRFHPGEEANDPDFAKQLAALADFFVNDAFGAAHRAHASTEGVTHYLKSASGLLMEKEIRYLGETLSNPPRPFILILGGAKVSDKIGMIESLLPKCDCVLIGGAMSYTFLKAQGKEIGSSKVEQDKIGLAAEILEKAKKINKDILLPIDHVVVDRIEAALNLDIAGENIPQGKIAVDIGPKTERLFKERLESAKIIVWNGPLGIFEIDVFSKGTKSIAEFIAALNCITIICGGDTAAAAAKFNLEDKMTHISTGGGASLEFLEGKTLPGIAALTDANFRSLLE